MTTTTSIAARAYPTSASDPKDTESALRFITCGSVDDGKSTLIGRLLVDSKAVLQDHLAGVTRGGEADLALLTDGLQAEREQGITIDVAYRYFNTEARKFIIGDAPGHEQYTRNMVTAASQADAAVVLVDATKLDWADAGLALLAQTRRHSLLLNLLRVPSVVFAINKLDAVAEPEQAYLHIRGALQAFAREAGIEPAAIVPVSALKGWNVVEAGQAQPGWCGYVGPTLLEILERLPVTPREAHLPLALPVQWVEKPTAELQAAQSAGHSAGIVLDREVDVSRGDWIVAARKPHAVVAADDFDDDALPQAVWPTTRELSATIAWLDDEPLVAGRVYWALHGHRWVKAKVKRVVERLNIHTLAREEAAQLPPNAIGHVELALQEPIPATAFAHSRVLGALILVDTASHKTAGAVLVR